MSNTTISPYMNMPVPVVSVDPGPDWANNVDACLSIIDGHNHTTGNGNPVTSGGILINQDLPYNGNNATSVRSVRFNAQGSPIAGAAPDLGCIYEAGVDLYYNDGNGNQVRITQGGNVTGSSGTISGLPSGTASASYAASQFTFQSATSTPAQTNVGNLQVGQQVASGFGVTLAASGSQAANYNVTFPASLPSTTYPLQITNSGQLDVSGNLTALSAQIGDTTPPQFKMCQKTGALGPSGGLTITLGTAILGVIGMTTQGTGTSYFPIGNATATDRIYYQQTSGSGIGANKVILLNGNSTQGTSYNVTVFYL